jgi:hypothetical protein
MASSPSIQDIAAAALSFWDMYVDEAESELALKVSVTRELIDMGAPPETAAMAAALVDRVLNAQQSPNLALDAALKEHPLYQAMVAEVERSGYGPDEDF